MSSRVPLTKGLKFSTAVAPADGVAAQTDIEGTTLDMAGYDGVVMYCRFGAITAGGVQSVKAQSGAASDMSDAADLAGTKQTVGDGDDGEIFVIDLVRPAERYVRLYVDRATQDSVVAEAHYIQYRGKGPVALQGAGVNIERHVDPVEGTA
jgi:hypothetical protein